MKKNIILLLSFFLVIGIVNDANAQRKKKRPSKENTEEKSESRDRDDSSEFEGLSLKDKLNTEIKLGNLNFFGSVFSVSLKSNVGYKFNNIFSAGLGGKLYYDYINNFGPNDESYFSYGGLVYGRAKLSQQFYLQGEYSMVHFGSISTVQAENIAYPTVGLGYLQPGINWSMGLELLFILNDEARDRLNLVEYWFSFSHNF